MRMVALSRVCVRSTMMRFSVLPFALSVPGISAMASRALRMILTKTCSIRTRSAWTIRSPSNADCSSTQPSLCSCDDSNCITLSRAARILTGSSTPVDLREKVLSCPVIDPMRSVRAEICSILVPRFSGFPRSSISLALAQKVRIAAIGWLISCAIAADICPRAASLPA